MEKWSQRATLYKVTLLLTYFVFLVYGLAFSIPTWFGLEVAGAGATFQGLWLVCSGKDTADFDTCTKQAFGDDNSDWMDGVRGVWVGGMFFFLIGVLYSFVENCCGDEDSKDYGITGTCVLLAGLCGAAGVIVVAVKIEEDSIIDRDYFWGYMLACIASGLALILAVVLLITRNAMAKEKSRANRTADYVFAHKPANPYAPEYTNHGFARDDIPLSNGVSYAHTPAAHPYTMYQGGSGVYPGNSLPHPRNQGGYGQGYDLGKSNQRHSLAESADLSNGYTTELINAEHSLSRSQAGYRGVDYIRNDFPGRNDYYGGRPY